MTWESQKHWSQRAHGAAESYTSSKGQETTSQKKADGNCRWKVKFLDLHLTLAVVHYAAAVIITFVWSLFPSSLAAVAWQPQDYMAAARFDTSLLRSTQGWGGGGGGHDRNGWAPLERQRKWLTEGRKTNGNNSDAITGLCAKQTNGGVVTGPEQRTEAL